MTRGWNEFVAEVGQHQVRPPAPVGYAPSIAYDDDKDMSPGTPDEWIAETITGRTYVIEYSDLAGRQSTRQILCRRLEQRAAQLYLHAYCYARERQRAFRGDRILSIIDPITGEVHEPGLLLLTQFSPEHSTPAPWRLGLAPRQYSDFNAALNVLAFMARCDGEWHDSEAEKIEEFAIAYWLRAEIDASLDTDEVIRLAKRLAPDTETFWVSLNRCSASPIIARTIQRHIASVIQADGRIHDKELYWGALIDQHLRG